MKKNVIRLNDSFKTYTYDQDKVFTPIETIARFKDRLKKVDLDILKEVRRIDNGRLKIPVFFSVCGKDANHIIGTKKQMGKGCTPEQAQASACMELGERFSFFSFVKNPDNFLTATYTRVKAEGYPVIPLEQLLLSVHDTKHSASFLEKLLADIPIQWTWATNLTRSEEVLIPFSWFYAINEFNGPSAGNTYEEAIIQGICEIVERHVSAIVSHDRVKTPAIDMKSIDDPVTRDLIMKFTINGILLYLNDFTLNTGIPTVAALAIDPNTFPIKSEIVFTAGTTPNPNKALIRALTEVAQLAGDFDTGANYLASGLPKPMSLAEADYVIAPERMISLGDMNDIADNNLRIEIENCLSALQKIGMEVFVVDTMHEQLRIPAIYTIIPGAHFRERSRVNDVGLFAAKLVSELIPDPEEAIRKLLHLEKLLPDAYYLHFYIGRNHYALGRPEIALTYFHQASLLNPEAEDLPYIYSYMGHCHKDMEDYQGAIRVLEMARELEEARTDVHNLFGFCHFKLKNHRSAIDHFSRVVELNPSSAIDYANIATNYRELSNLPEAIRYYELAISIDPSLEFAKQNLQNLMTAEGSC